MRSNLVLSAILVLSGVILIHSKPNPQDPALQGQRQSGVCNMLCIVGYHCELCHGSTKCVPDKPGNNGQQPQPHPEPVTSCAAVLCPTGTTCQQETIQCFAAPCPQPKPRCVPNDPNSPTCDNVRCQAGTYCRLEQVQCITTPCPPQPRCVPCGPPVQTAPSSSGSSPSVQSQQSAINPCPIG